MQVMEAASTGCVAMTSIHAENAWDIPDRMLNMAGDESREGFESDIYTFFNYAVKVKKGITENGIVRKVDQLVFFSHENGQNKTTIFYKDGKLTGEELPAPILEKMRNETEFLKLYCKLFNKPFVDHSDQSFKTKPVETKTLDINKMLNGEEKESSAKDMISKADKVISENKQKETAPSDNENVKREEKTNDLINNDKEVNFSNKQKEETFDDLLNSKPIEDIEDLEETVKPPKVEVEQKKLNFIDVHNNLDEKLQNIKEKMNDFSDPLEDLPEDDSAQELLKINELNDLDDIEDSGNLEKRDKSHDLDIMANNNANLMSKAIQSIPKVSSENADEKALASIENIERNIEDATSSELEDIEEDINEANKKSFSGFEELSSFLDDYNNSSDEPLDDLEE